MGIGKRMVFGLSVVAFMQLFLVPIVCTCLYFSRLTPEQGLFLEGLGSSISFVAGYLVGEY